jgi:hypothetical protein
MPEEDIIDIPLYCSTQIKDGSIGQYSLQWTLPDNWPSNWKISLHDHRSEKVVSMNENTKYNLDNVTEDTVPSTFGKLPLPNKLVKIHTDSSLLRSARSLPPFSIVLSKGSDIEYMAAKPELLGNFPNPFQKMSMIRFSLPQRAKVLVEVFTLQGKRIALLADGYYSAGITEVRWNALNITPGMYVIRFSTGETVENKKAILIN